MSWADSGQQSLAFTSKIPRSSLSPRMYLGFTGSNSREDGSANMGDRINLERLQVKSSHPQPYSDGLDSISGSNPTENLYNVIKNHFIPRQEHLLNEINKLHQSSRALTDRFDALQIALTRLSPDRKIKDTVGNHIPFKINYCRLKDSKISYRNPMWTTIRTSKNCKTWKSR